MQNRIKPVRSADPPDAVSHSKCGSATAGAAVANPVALPPLATALQQFDHLPASANVRLPVVIGLFGCSAPTVWRRVKSGGVPAPRKIGGTTVWNVGELRAALRAISE